MPRNNCRKTSGLCKRRFERVEVTVYFFVHDDVHLVVYSANRRAALEAPGFNILGQCPVSIVIANMCSSHSWSHFKLDFSLITFIDSYDYYAVFSNTEETNRKQSKMLILDSFFEISSSPLFSRSGRVFKHTRSLWCRWMLEHCWQLLLQVSPGILHLCGRIQVYRWVLCRNGCHTSPKRQWTALHLDW